MANDLDRAGTAMVKAMSSHQRCLPPEPRVSKGLPRQVNTPMDPAEFHARVNDAMG